MSDITANTWRPTVEVQILGRDDQGRQTYLCRCGEVGYFDEDGFGHCPTGDTFRAYLRTAWERLALAPSSVERSAEGPMLRLEP